MKNLTYRILPLVLAVTLQVMPLVRWLLPAARSGLAPSAWSIILKFGVGSAALLGGYDAHSGASKGGGVSNSILPVNGSFTINLTNGVFFKVKLATSPDAAGSWTTNATLNHTTPYFTLFAGFSLTNATGYLGGTPETFSFDSVTTYSQTIDAWGTGTTAGDKVAAVFTFVVEPGPNQTVWSGADSSQDLDWTDGGNWWKPGVPYFPLPSQGVLFYDLGAASAPGTVDNIVDGTLAI